MKSYATPFDICPVCSYITNRAAAVDDQVPPKPGDYSICFNCTSFVTFDDDMRIVLLTDNEIAQMPFDVVILLNRTRKLIQDSKKETGI